jgi:putative (di)nucleoside polyphosphate hydrolase
MLINKLGLVFVGRRIDNSADKWQMPQGGIDDGENPQEAAFRELMEEVGTANAEVVASLDEWLYYDLPDELKGKMWGGKYLGQRQRWFAMRFLGEDSEINIQTEEPEFQEWKWIEREQLPDLIVEFKRELYKKVLKEFQEVA